MIDVRLAEPQEHAGLTLVPLCSDAPLELPYQLLTDALTLGSLRITEIGEGTVPALFALNDAADPVLVLDGEQLIGARQNRMTNRTILLPARSKTRIPVSCMEQGRWRSVSEEFAPSPQHSPSKVRRKARDLEVSYSLSDLAAPPEVLSEAQGDIWDEIHLNADRAGAHSDTRALNDLFRARATDVDAWVTRYPAVEGQVGLVAFLGGVPLGMDVIGGQALYARLHDRLMRGYVMDALGTKPDGRTVSAEAAQRFLDGVREARRTPSPSVGIGEYAVLSRTVVGGELLEAERVVHVSAFPVEAPQGRPIASPRQRRRNHE
jgi:hypothetical protein